jgi:hypothetical protein
MFSVHFVLDWQVQGRYFIWQLSFVASCPYSSTQSGLWSGRKWQHAEQRPTHFPVLSSYLRQMAPLVSDFLRSFISKRYTTVSVSGCVLHVRSVPRSCFLKMLGCSEHTCEVIWAAVRRMKLWILPPAVLWTAYRAVYPLYQEMW